MGFSDEFRLLTGVLLKLFSELIGWGEAPDELARPTEFGFGDSENHSRVEGKERPSCGMPAAAARSRSNTVGLADTSR